MHGLTTHILDLTHGQPAKGVTIELFYFEGEKKQLIKTAVTNEDGRLTEPLLASAAIKTGEYELLFAIGDYFKNKRLPASEPAFLNKVAVRIGLDGSAPHYHVPLLVSPWGYQVYRGS